MVAVDEWSKMNPTLAAYLGDIAEVNDENLEKIIELKPDLIIAAGDVKNFDKLSKIAPLSLSLRAMKNKFIFMVNNIRAVQRFSIKRITVSTTLNNQN